MEYLLKASIIITIFLLCYKVFLQRDTFFESNRWFLLIGLITAFCIPFIVIPIYIIQDTAPIQKLLYFEATTAQNDTNNTIDIMQMIYIVYIIGLTFFFIRFLIQLYSISLVLIRNKKQHYKNYTFIETSNDVLPFSFFKWVVYNPNKFNESELKQILAHEKIHVKQWHSIDILISQLISIVLWFNPFMWLYKKNLQQNLEFIADQNVNKKANCKKSYQQLLLKTSVPNYPLALTNNFYNSLIKKRIIMLHKNKSRNRNYLKFTLILPLLGLFIMSFNTKEIILNNNQDSLNKTIDETPVSIGEIIEVIISKDSKDADLKMIKTDFKNAGAALKFSGIKRNDKDEIIAIRIEVSSKNSNSNYNVDSDKPINSIKITFDSEDNSISIGNESQHHFKKIEGYSFISKDGNHKIHTTGKGSNTFVFTSDDDDDQDNDEKVVFTKINGEIHKTEDIDSVKVSHHMSNFSWTSNDREESYDINTIGKGNNKFFFSSDKGKDPIFILNNKKVSKKEIDNVESNNIESVNILKGDAATKLYGKKAKGGVIIITTKKE